MLCVLSRLSRGYVDEVGGEEQLVIEVVALVAFGEVRQEERGFMSKMAVFTQGGHHPAFP